MDGTNCKLFIAEIFNSILCNCRYNQKGYVRIKIKPPSMKKQKNWTKIVKLLFKHDWSYLCPASFIFFYSTSFLQHYKRHRQIFKVNIINHLLIFFNLSLSLSHSECLMECDYYKSIVTQQNPSLSLYVLYCNINVWMCESKRNWLIFASF